MQKKVSEDELLESLRRLAAMDYMSDLHDTSNKAVVLAAIKEAHFLEYSDDDWRAAASYILRERVELESRREIWQLLSDKLKENEAGD